MRGSRFRLLSAALLALGVLVAAMFIIQRIGWLTQRSEGNSSRSSSSDGTALPPLVFARNGNIWRSRGDGSPPEPITQHEGSSFAIRPAVSPDGQRVAYAVVEQPDADAIQPISTSKLYIMGNDGSEPVLVWDAPQGLINNMTWTRDAKSLYVGITGLRAAPVEIGGMQLPEIVVVDVATGAIRPFIEDASEPVVAPDGEWVAYIAISDSAGPEADKTMTLQMTTPDAGEVRVVVDDPAFKSLYAPRFSPDGTRLVFAAVGGPATSTPSTTSRRLEGLPGLFEQVLSAITPAAQAHGQPYDLWTVNVDGTNLQRITQINEDEPMAVFAPDGKELVIMASRGIYRMNADGSQLQVIDNTGGHGGLDWLSQ